MGLDLSTVTAIGMTMMTIIIGLFQWSLSGNYKRQAEIGRQRDNQIDKLSERLVSSIDDCQRFKEEVHTNYIRHDTHHIVSQEIRSDMGKLFDRLDDLSQQLNQLVGAIGRRASDA